MAKAKSGAESTAKSPQVVYVGPNRLNKALKTYTIYKAMPQELIDSLKGEYPSISQLFVSVDDLSKATISVGKKGTPINLAYREVTGGAE